MRGTRARYLLVGVLALAVVATLALVSADNRDRGTTSPANDPVVVAVGDMACDPRHSSFRGGEGSASACRAKHVSDAFLNAGLAAVLALGDTQYYCGGYDAYLRSYDQSWGRLKDITRPAPGNHEYIVGGRADRTGCDATNAQAAGYYRYFGAAAGDPAKGYYSFDIGAWHLVVLNSTCSAVGGCGADSAQVQWLQADLAAHPNDCTLAYWHQPLFSSGGRGNPAYRPFWDALYDADADLVLNAHEHLYERYAPQNPAGQRDDGRGLRQFLVGTGGANSTPVVTVQPNSEVQHAATFGALKLTLRATSYDWAFVPEAGESFTDTGSGQCHTSDSPAPTVPPTATASALDALTFLPVDDTDVRADKPVATAPNAGILHVDGSPVRRSFLRFTVSGLAGRSVRSAKLRLFCVDASHDGGSLHRVQGGWTASKVTWRAQPAYDKSVLAMVGPVVAGSWYEVDLKDLVTGDGTYDLAFDSAAVDGADYVSSEGPAARRPMLVVTAS